VFGDDVYPNPYYEPPELLLAPTRAADADFKKIRIDWWINALRSARETETRRAEAEQLAVTLEEDRLRAIARTNDMAARMSAIAEIAGGVTVAETADDLREMLVEACQRVISFDALIISSYDEASHTFDFLGAWDQGVYSTPAVVPAAGTPAERVVRERRTLITRRSSDPEAAGAVPTGTHRRSESVIRAPLIAAGRVIGVLAVHSYTPDLYNADDARVVEAVAALASAAIQRIESRTQKDAELQRRQAAEEQLAHAQKMEAVGRLAGGISHDFNNLLVAIGGYAHLAFAELETDHPARADLLEVIQGVERATALTRQLLAFSRKQVLTPIDVDLARTVRETEKLLRRLIRADIVLDVSADSPCQVRIDPSQLEQMIVNLVVNARDAMPEGGQIDVRVDRVQLTDAGEGPVGARPGEYARLSVSDNGEGMDAVTRESIFEPFFTTKPAGQGTGLGLSMVYGIITQSGGYIDVHSEPGVGTRMEIYLPCGGPSDSTRP
jgi:signal transduction histidine kinase